MNRINTHILALMVVCLASAGAWAQEADPYRSVVGLTGDNQRQVAATIEAEIRKAPASEHKAIETRLLSVIQDAQATPDAKNFACRMLAIVGSGQCAPAVAPLLADEKTSHMARFALEPIADPAAAAALRQALAQVKGKLLVGVISSIGARRDAQAISALSALANDADAPVAAAALGALGQIGTLESAQTLDALKVAKSLTRTQEQAKIACAGRLAQAGQKTPAINIYKSLLSAADAPASRFAAARGLIASESPAEAAALVAGLAEDATLQSAVLVAFRESPSNDVTNAIVAQLPTFKPAAQKALLGALADMSDVAARESLLKLLDAPDAQVRIAALDCLVRHAQAADVPVLVKLASRNAPESAAARRTLEQMSAGGVDEALIALIQSADPQGRNVVYGVLASRRVTAAIPVLVKVLGGSDAPAAAEAAKALEPLGSAEQLPALVAVLEKTPDATVRAAVESTAATLCTRTPDKQACAQAVLPALQRSASLEARLSLLRLLPRIRTPEALAAVRQALAEANPTLRDAAVRTLVDWPEMSAVPFLIELAKASDEKQSVLAVRGCLRLAGSAKDQPMPQRLNVYREVLNVARRNDEKKQALAGAAELPTVAALELLQKYTSDPVLSQDATLAVIRSARQLGAVNSQKATAALEQIKAQTTAADLRTQAEEAIKQLKNAGQGPDGTILAWLVAAPFVQEGKDAAALFSIAFAPEKEGSQGVEWRPVTLPASSNGLIELNKLLGGNDRVAYLRTAITSPTAQTALLELGSDDGVKVWLNGKLVHQNNVTRPARLGDDKVKLPLLQGTNTLLLKITQGGGEWSACARLRSPDGKDLPNLLIAPND